MKPSAPSEQHSLSAYLAFAFSLMSILLTLILTAVMERSATAHVERSIGANLAELAHQTASRLDRSMFERHREVRLMTQRLKAYDDPELLTRELAALQASYPYYAWIGLADPTGKVLASTKDMLVGQDVSKRPWFSGALNGKNVGDVHEAVMLAKLLGNTASGEPPRFVDVAFPTVDANGRATGVLGAHLSWDWADDIQHTIFVAVDKTRAIEPLIISEDGTVRLGPAELRDTRLKLPSLDAALASKTGYRVESWPDGETYLVGYTSSKGYKDYPGLGWSVLVRQPLSEAYAPVRHLQLTVFVSGLVIAGLFSVLGWYAARTITRPVLELAQFARGLGEGTNPVRLKPLNAAYREAGQLGDSLNSMLDSLQRKDEKLRQLNANLERRVEERTAELREALRQVQRSEQRVQTIIETAQDPFIGMDFEGRITDWNPQAEKLFGWSREEVLGRPLTSTLLPERYVAKSDAALARFRETGAAPFINQRLERVVIDRHGREIHVEVKLGLVNTEHLQLFSGFVHDITDRKESERLKSEFISTVSHELRTPLTAIYGSLSLLESGMAGELPADAAKMVTMSTRSCERLVRLINDVLDVEKLDARLLSYDMKLRPLAGMLEQATNDIGPYAAPMGIRVSLVTPLPEVSVRADSDRIVQVLMNLLSNAVKFSPQGGTVEVAAKVINGTVRVSVVDHGEGVPPQFHTRIFDRFAQADGSDRRRSGGTGLGLNICRSIVQAHGGTISFSSEPGVRTEFYFELPLA